MLIQSNRIYVVIDWYIIGIFQGRMRVFRLFLHKKWYFAEPEHVPIMV